MGLIKMYLAPRLCKPGASVKGGWCGATFDSGDAYVDALHLLRH